MKIFVLSLHRSATRSTHSLLERAGFKSIHWPMRWNGESIQHKLVGHETDLDFVFAWLEPFLGVYDAFSDVPVPVLYAQAYARFPDARFILVTRKAKDWLASMRRHVNTRRLHPAEAVQYWRYLKTCPETLAGFSDGDLSAFYRRHTRAVTGFFARRGASAQLLRVRADDPACGEKICAFLGAPPQPLPHIGRTPAPADAA